MTKKPNHGNWLWSINRSMKTMKAVGLEPREVESALWSRGLRVRIRNWMDVERRYSPSLATFVDLVEVCGLQERPFSEVIRMFLEQRLD